MNNGLVPSQSSNMTDNPQTIYDNANGVNSSYLQQGAGMDSLRQNHELSVVQTGEPIQSAQLKSGTSGILWVLIIVGLFLLAVAGKLIRKWLKKHPKLVIKTVTKNDKPKAKPINSKVSKPKVKKKQPRSKRRK